ncbi:unnamed protein product, partial [Adineta steineri]
MVLNFLKKFDYWGGVGGVDGYITAVKQLGSDYTKLESDGCSKLDSIWGRLAEFTKLDNKSTYDARKWLYTAWNDDRREVKTTFLNTQVTTVLSNDSNQSPNNIAIVNNMNIDTVPKNVSLLTIQSTVPKSMRPKNNKIPRYVHYFTMNYDQWKLFFDHKIGDVYDGWGDKITPHLVELRIPCAINFRYHHSRLIDSRKHNSTLFNAKGYCTAELCPVKIDIGIVHEPKQKGAPTLFKVVVIGEKNHDPKQKPFSRQITGEIREAMAKEIKKNGGLRVYERNLRHANEDLLKEGNFSEVPSQDVLKTIKQQYDKKFRYDEDCFKDLRIFAYVTRYEDIDSEDVKGFVQTDAQWPFTVYFFTEIQLDRFVYYCRSEKYSCLHIDATGSVVRKLKDQKDVFFYCMVFRHEDSSILQLSGALLTDHTAASITSYFLSVRSKLALRSKVTRPAFVIIDFSAALINSVLASFNVENIHTYLRRCYNTINRVYNTKQLRNITFLRLCCSHAMKAFSRSLFKINVSKDTHHNLMTFFAVLLNSTNFDGAFDLYKHIIQIYGNPYCDTPYTALASLLNKSESPEFDIEPYLEESNVQNDKDLTQDFLDETDITTDPIIRQSPFNIKACTDIPALRRILEKKKLDDEPRNQLYSKQIIHVLHKWFAYIPLWSNIMTNFFERYAKDKTPISTNKLEFGHENRTTSRPTEFLMPVHKHILARMKGDQFSVAQTSHGRKKKRDKMDDLNVKDMWKCRPQTNSKTNKHGAYFNEKVSEMVACKISKGKNQEKLIAINDKSCSPKEFDAPTKKIKTFDDPDSDSDESMNSIYEPSIQYSVLSSHMPITTNTNDCNYVIDPSSPLPIIVDESPMTPSISLGNVFFTVSDGIEPHLAQVFCPKRSHSSSNSSCSISIEKTSKQLCEKKIKPSSSPHTIENRNFQSSKDNRTTTISSLKLTWPSYGIENATYAGEHYFIFHTCTVDTGLFILYHAYKTQSDDFRNLFLSDTLSIYKIIHRTFQLVDTNGWTTARLYWLTENNILTDKRSDGKYDLMNTMEAIIFQFIKVMQAFPIKSKCTCVVCPKRTCEQINVDITLPDREHACRKSLGRRKPRNYPAEYSLDNKFPVVDVETNVKRTEKHYICEAARLVDKAKFLYRAPFVIIDVGKDSTVMTELPDPLYIGEYT